MFLGWSKQILLGKACGVRPVKGDLQAFVMVWKPALSGSGEDRGGTRCVGRLQSHVLEILSLRRFSASQFSVVSVELLNLLIHMFF